MSIDKTVGTDMGLVVTIIASSTGIIAVVIAMFFWIRSEANNDRRHMQDLQREDRKEILEISRNIQNEMKDFHFQLIEIEKSRSKS